MLAHILIPLALVLLLLVLCREIKETYDMPLNINRPHQEQQPDPVKDQKHAQKEKDTVRQINKLRVLYGARIGPENIEEEKRQHASHDHQELPLSEPSDCVVFQRARRLRICEEEENEDQKNTSPFLPEESAPLPSVCHGFTVDSAQVSTQTEDITTCDQPSQVAQDLEELHRHEHDMKSVPFSLIQLLSPMSELGFEISQQQLVVQTQDQDVQTDEPSSTADVPTQVDVETHDRGTTTEDVVTSSIGTGDALDQTTQGVQCDVIREIVVPIRLTIEGLPLPLREHQEGQTSVILPLDDAQDGSISPISNASQSAVVLAEELQGVAVENILQQNGRSQDRSRRRSVLSQLAPIREEEIEESPLVGIRRIDEVFDEPDQFRLSRVISTRSIPISEEQSSLHIGLNSVRNESVVPSEDLEAQSFNISHIQTVVSRPLEEEEEASRLVTVSPMVSPMTSRSSSQDHEEDH